MDYLRLNWHITIPVRSRDAGGAVIAYLTFDGVLI